MQPAAAVDTRPLARRAMMVPWLDTGAVGGISLVLLPLVVLFVARPLRASAGGLVLLGVLFNWPHFIGSYRLLYATGESVRRYRTASIYVPAALAGYALFAHRGLAGPPVYREPAGGGGGGYLARHYTGQAWGMMASSLTWKERRSPLRTPPVPCRPQCPDWCGTRSGPAPVGGTGCPVAVAPVTRLYAWTIWLPGPGADGRPGGNGRFPAPHGPLTAARVLVLGRDSRLYVAMAIEPGALFVVQIAHGLQYLMFPLRVEMNRAASPATGNGEERAPPRGLDLVGLAVFEGLEPLFRLGFEAAGGQGRCPVVVSSVIIAAIAIPHYFIDGALYKLRNPEVRRDLFAHLPRQ